MLSAGYQQAISRLSLQLDGGYYDEMWDITSRGNSGLGNTTTSDLVPVHFSHPGIRNRPRVWCTLVSGDQAANDNSAFTRTHKGCGLDSYRVASTKREKKREGGRERFPV